MESYKVIMVDDSPIDHLIVERICRHEGLFANVSHLNSAHALLNTFKTYGNNIPQLPDIILLDLNMHDLNGWDFLRQFNNIYRQLGKIVDVYILSSSLNPVDRERALAYPFVKSFFIKPMSRFSLRELYQRYSGGNNLQVH